jgi:hypothetical protein
MPNIPSHSKPGALPRGTLLVLVLSAVAGIGVALALYNSRRSRSVNLAKELSRQILTGDVSRVLEIFNALRSTKAIVHVGADELVALSCQPHLLPALTALLQARALGFAQFDIDTRGPGGATPLVAAAAAGNTKAVALLVATGANPLIADDSGLCAAHLAAKYGHLSCLKGLIISTEGSKTNFSLFDAQRSADGATPLMLAASENQVSKCARRCMYLVLCSSHARSHLRR